MMEKLKSHKHRHLGTDDGDSTLGSTRRSFSGSGSVQ
jgi:hypothetical protein